MKWETHYPLLISIEFGLHGIIPSAQGLHLRSVGQQRWPELKLGMLIEVREPLPGTVPVCKTIFRLFTVISGIGSHHIRKGCFQPYWGCHNAWNYHRVKTLGFPCLKAYMWSSKPWKDDMNTKLDRILLLRWKNYSLGAVAGLWRFYFWGDSPQWNCLDFGMRQKWVKFWFPNFPTMKAWASYLTSLSLCFLIGVMEIMIYNPQKSLKD